MIIPFCKALRIPKIIGTPTTNQARGKIIFCNDILVFDMTAFDLLQLSISHKEFLINWFYEQI